MKAIDLIRFGLKISADNTLRLTEALRAAPLTFPQPGARGGDGNHALWTIGHLAVIESGMPDVLLGEDHPYEHWWPIFGPGTEPTSDAGAYPPFDEVLSVYRDSRSRNLALLESIGEAGLDRVPKNVPSGFEDVMTSIGSTLQLIALHNMQHCGQLADLRRAVGLKRFM